MELSSFSPLSPHPVGLSNLTPNVPHAPQKAEPSAEMVASVQATAAPENPLDLQTQAGSATPELSLSLGERFERALDRAVDRAVEVAADTVTAASDAGFDAAGWLFKNLSGVQPIQEAPIDPLLLQPERLTRLSSEQITEVAVQMLAQASEDGQTVYSNEFRSDAQGHQYMGVGQAVYLSPEEVESIRAQGENAIKLFISQFPNGASVIAPEHYEALRTESLSMNMRGFLEGQEELAQIMVSIRDAEGSNLSGQRVLLGTGSIVDIRNHQHIETERYLINTMTPETTELHPLRGAVTWVHIIDKDTGKSMFGNFGAGDHHSQMVDLGNNLLIELGMFNEMGKKAMAEVQGEDYNPIALKAFGLGERLNSAVSYWNMYTEKQER